MAILSAGLSIYLSSAFGYAHWRQRRPVDRREGTLADDDPTTLDLGYRNPRWAACRPDAVRPAAGYESLVSVDGTPELLKRAGLAAQTATQCVVSREAASLDVWLMPSATYHIDELGPVLTLLRARGMTAGLVFGAEPSMAQLAAAAAYAPEVYLAADQEGDPPAVVLSMKDWGPDSALLHALARRGTRILSKVEGAQDFTNLDTPRRLYPYSRSTCVLAQGGYDETHVAADRVEVVGSVRLERLLPLVTAGMVEAVDHGPLLNLNFSYGTYEAWLRPWYALARRGFEAARVDTRTTVHPAVVAPFVEDRTRWPLALEIETSSHLVTRCSTAVFDALLLGRPVVYFNPHRERVWRDVPWSASVPQVRTPGSLAATIQRLQPDDQHEIALRQAFVREHFVSIDPVVSAAQRTAQAIEAFA